MPQLLDLALKLGDGLFEIQEIHGLGFYHRLAPDERPPLRARRPLRTEGKKDNLFVNHDKGLI